MATVHPSRLGLVPQPSSLRGGERHNDSDRDRYSEKRRDSRREDSRDRGRSDGRRRERSPSPYRKSRVHDDEKRTYEREERPRRSSPDYSSYRREEPPHMAAANVGGTAKGPDASVPWRAPENMYTSRGRGRPAGGEDYFASRRRERASKEVNIWPPSPKEPTRDILESKKKKRSSKRRRSSSLSSDDDDDRERRRRKEKKRKEKKDREDRKEKHKKKHRRERSYDDDSGDDHRHRGRRSRSYRSDEDSNDEQSRSQNGKHREKSRQKSRHSSRAATPPRSHVEEEEAEWEEKPADSFVAVAEHTGRSPRMDHTTTEEKNADEESDPEEVGPQPMPRATTTGKKVDERQYGGALLRGEGSAMAAFLQDGDTQARIPRRGEIGLTSGEIAEFESVGYVMSGSRHRRMNAVRMRKENQVISAEEKRGILKLQREERERREAILRDEFRELVEDKLKGTGAVVPTTQEEDEE